MYKFSLENCQKYSGKPGKLREFGNSDPVATLMLLLVLRKGPEISLQECIYNGKKWNLNIIFRYLLLDYFSNHVGDHFVNRLAVIM